MFADLLPAKARQVLYALLSLLGLLLAVWQATEGDPLLFVSGVIAALTGELARSNVTDEVS